MTKKHFIAFARYIKDALQYEALTRDEAHKMATMVIAIAQVDNARFDTGRFLTACGLEPRR